MELNQTRVLPVSQAQAWQALNDVELLRSSISGCESLTAIGEHRYRAMMVVSVGPVKAAFSGMLHLHDLNPPHSYSLVFEGQGGAAGHAKGHARIRLEADGIHQTLLHYSAHASVGGRIAQIGSRLVDMAAQRTANEFFENFTKRLEERHGLTAAAPAKPRLLARIIACLRRLAN